MDSTTTPAPTPTFHLRGEAHDSAKLTNSDVRYIRDNPGISIAELQVKYPYISRVALWRVRNKITWKHLP